MAETSHVTKRKDGKWQVKKEHGERASKVTDTKAEAVEYAKSHGPTKIHKKDGSFQSQSTDYSDRTKYHVTPNGGDGWKVKLENGEKTIETFATKAEAVDRARDLATYKEDGTVVVHRKDGTVQKHEKGYREFVGVVDNATKAQVDQIEKELEEVAKEYPDADFQIKKKVGEKSQALEDKKEQTNDKE